MLAPKTTDHALTPPSGNEGSSFWERRLCNWICVCLQLRLSGNHAILRQRLCLSCHLDNAVKGLVTYIEKQEERVPSGRDCESGHDRGRATIIIYILFTTSECSSADQIRPKLR